MERTATFCAAGVLAAAAAAAGVAWAEPDHARAQTQAFFAALEGGDLGALEEMMHPEIVNTLPFAASGATDAGAMRVFDGREQVLAYFAGASQAIPEVAFEELEITLANDGAVAFVETRGDMRLADGREYRNLYVWRLSFEDGRIVEIVEYFNPVTAAEAFGRPVGSQSVD